MEDVLDVYMRPYDPACPVVCLDKTSVQLVAETRTPLPMAPGQPARCAFEYKRRGVAVVFVLTEPLRRWRKAVVRRSPDADRLRTCRQAPGRCAFPVCRAGHP